MKIRNGLWKKLPRKVQYQTFKVIINYLINSGKIMIDENDEKVVWTYNIEKIKKELFLPGNKTQLIILEAKPQLTEKEIKNKNNIKYTNVTRTIIDLYCDNKAFLADKIIGKVK